VSNTTQQRLDAFRQQRRVQAGSLIITAFGDAILPRGGRIWLGSLIRLLEPLELNERLIRTSVSGWPRRNGCAPKPSAGAPTTCSPLRPPPFEEASRHIYAGQAPLWDRRWRLILVVGELEPSSASNCAAPCSGRASAHWAPTASCTRAPNCPACSTP
jgi:phenylacetic acid degradation operon negative regulatory protein